MRDHLGGIVKNALAFFERHDILVRDVLDIAANDLYTLKQYPKDINLIGIDPCDIIREVDSSGIRIINECFPSKSLYAGVKFDIISSIACFYDIDDPLDFVVNVEKLLKNNGIWIVEFAYLPLVLERKAYDGMCAEHVTLYSLASFENILSKTGLKVFKAEINDTNGGALQCWVCQKDNRFFGDQTDRDNLLRIRINEYDLCLDDIQTYYDFAKKVENHREDLVKALIKIKVEGKKIHIYGMSTKMNTILQYCNIGPDIIECAAERSKEKVGAKTISGIPMVSEEESRSLKPDYYLVGPYHFKKEILEREGETIKAGTKFIFPLPEIEIV